MCVWCVRVCGVCVSGVRHSGMEELLAESGLGRTCFRRSGLGFMWKGRGLSMVKADGWRGCINGLIDCLIDSFIGLNMD